LEAGSRDLQVDPPVLMRVAGVLNLSRDLDAQA
jgi:hypothetical protein